MGMKKNRKFFFKILAWSLNIALVLVIGIIYFPKAQPDLDFWGGHTLAELMNAEKRATEEALRQAGRPNLTAIFPRVDAYSVGYFLMTLEIATVFAGSFIGIDPLNQPGVELGKVLTKKRLGVSE